MAFELRGKIREFLAGFLPQFHRDRCHFFARASVVVYVQFHDEATTNVVCISLCRQWQEFTNGNSYR